MTFTVDYIGVQICFLNHSPPPSPPPPHQDSLPAVRPKALSMDLIGQDDKVVDKLALQNTLIGIVKLVVGAVEVCNK